MWKGKRTLSIVMLIADYYVAVFFWFLTVNSLVYYVSPIFSDHILMFAEHTVTS